jgi:hypothetical protein
VDLRSGTNPQQHARIVDSPDPCTTPDSIGAAVADQPARRLVVAASFKDVSPAGAATAGPLDQIEKETWGVDAATGPLTSAHVRIRDAARNRVSATLVLEADAAFEPPEWDSATSSVRLWSGVSHIAEPTSVTRTRQCC